MSIRRAETEDDQFDIDYERRQSLIDEEQDEDPDLDLEDN